MSTRQEVRSRVFQGIAGPVIFNGNGNLAMLQDAKLIDSDMLHCLLTGLTEPFMEPGDGVGLETQLFEPGDEVTYVVLRNFIKARLADLDPRVELVDVFFKRSLEAGDETKLLVTIVYKIPTLIREGSVQSYSLTVPIGG